MTSDWWDDDGDWWPQYLLFSPVTSLGHQDLWLTFYKTNILQLIRNNQLVFYAYLKSVLCIRPCQSIYYLCVFCSASWHIVAPESNDLFISYSVKRYDSMTYQCTYNLIIPYNQQIERVCWIINPPDGSRLLQLFIKAMPWSTIHSWPLTFWVWPQPQWWCQPSYVTEDTIKKLGLGNVTLTSTTALLQAIVLSKKIPIKPSCIVRYKRTEY